MLRPSAERRQIRTWYRIRVVGAIVCRCNRLSRTSMLAYTPKSRPGRVNPLRTVAFKMSAAGRVHDTHDVRSPR
jgi:hypothetical protein